MVRVRDKINFNVTIDEIVDYLKISGYKYHICKTCLEENAVRWQRGRKFDFQESLADDNLLYFAYIKFYICQNGEKYALVSGKSGSKKVNYSGCDLSFSTNIKHGRARKWLKCNEKKWCVTEILVIHTNATEKNKSNKEAYDIEGCLQQKFDLYGS